MWTAANRGFYDRSGQRYPSDLTDLEWELVGPLIPPAKRGGNKRTVDEREVVNRLAARAGGVQGRGERHYAWLEHLLRYIEAESKARADAWAEVTTRVAEILFIYTLREYVRVDPTPTDALIALSDHRIEGAAGGACRSVGGLVAGQSCRTRCAIERPRSPSHFE